jgi:DNA-binding NarL/FixJ family response regulator
MATTFNSLIVDTDERAAAGLAAALLEHGLAAKVVDTVDLVAQVLAGRAADVVMLGAGLPALEQAAIQRLVQKHEAVLLVGVSGAECTVADLERALRLGAAAVFRAGADLAVRDAALTAALERRRATMQVQEELRRVKFQSEELRRRCAQQAERFQESQETFFLDLSRMMTIITNIMDGIVFVGPRRQRHAPEPGCRGSAWREVLRRHRQTTPGAARAPRTRCGAGRGPRAPGWAEGGRADRRGAP